MSYNSYKIQKKFLKQMILRNVPLSAITQNVAILKYNHNKDQVIDIIREGGKEKPRVVPYSVNLIRIIICTTSLLLMHGRGVKATSLDPKHREEMQDSKFNDIKQLNRPVASAVRHQ